MIDRLQAGSVQLPLAQTKPSGNAIELGQKFGAALEEAMNGLNRQHAEVERLNQAFIAGDLENSHQVLLAAQKAAIGLELTVELRNKVVEAYQEIMRMQI